MDIKRINTDKFNDCFIGIDTSRRDCSHLLFQTKFDCDEFFSEFIDPRLISCNGISQLHDTVGFLRGDFYYNFTVDTFGGLYTTCHNFTAGHNDENNMSNLDDKIVELYQNFHFNFVYNEEKEIDNLVKYKDNVNKNDIDNNNKDEELSDISDDSICEESMNKHKEEDYETGIDFGTALVNGRKQKVYQLQNKRKIIEKVRSIEINKSEDDFNMNIELDLDKDEYKNFDLDCLYRSLEEQLHSK
jgi:hypothetical protein